MSLRLPPSRNADDRQRGQSIEEFSKQVQRIDSDVSLVGGRDIVVGAGANNARKATNALLERKNVKDYGAVGDGTTDDTDAIELALADGGCVIFPEGTYRITNALAVPSDTVIEGTGWGSVISVAADIDGFSLSSVSDVAIRDLYLDHDAATLTNLTTGISISGSSNVFVESVRVDGVSYCGVLGTGGSTRIRVEGCLFSGFQNTQNDSSDIAFYNGCTNSKAVDNWCNGGGDHGIRFQLNSLYNSAINNSVYTHGRYGIILSYENTEQKTWNIAAYNVVRDITGASDIGGAFVAGTGIYATGCGQVQIIGNIVENCCTSTVTETLVPAGIGLSFLASECTVQDNIVRDCDWYGIGVFSNDNNVPITISGNTVRNNEKTAIYAKDAGNLLVSGNVVDNVATAAVTGIHVYGLSADVTNVSVTDNWIRGGASGMTRGIHMQNVNKINVSNNTVEDPATYGIYIDTCDDGILGHNMVTDAGSVALRYTASNDIAGTGGMYDSDGTYSVEATGTGSALRLDFPTITPQLVNSATSAGFNISFRGSAAPVSGNWIQGDIVYDTTPSASGTIGWVCTTTGNPGTWKTWGSIAS